MHWPSTFYVMPLFIIAVISATLAFYAWQRRSTPGAATFAFLMIVITEWSLGYALELGSADLVAKIFWGKVQYLGIATLPLAWLVFALQYTQRQKWLTRRSLMLLAIVPLMTLLLIWTNEAHGLMWRQTRLDRTGPFLALDVTYGPWFWVHSSFAYALLFLGTFYLIMSLLESPHLYRQQAGVLLLGGVIPWLGNGLYIAGLSPIPNLDLTPFAFTLSGVIFAWGLFRFQLLDIAPVAHRAIVNSLSAGVIVLDTQNRIIELNRAAQRIIGVSEAEAIGQPAAHILANYADLVERYRDVLETRTEITLLDREKTERHYDLRISALVDQRHEQVTGRLIVFYDITERKCMEAALRESQERFRRLNEAAFEGLVIHDKGRILEANQALARMFGYELSELDGKSTLDLTIPEYRNLVWQNILAQSERPYESVGLRKDGTTFDIEVIGRPFPYQGQIVRVVAVRDISARKKIEQALRHSEERFRYLVENAGDDFFVHDMEGKFVEVNERACRNLGYSREELLSMAVPDVDPDWEYERMTAVIKELPLGVPVTAEGNERRKDGTLFPVEVRFVKLEFGGRHLVLALARDITERKQIEADLAQIRDQALEASRLKSQLLAKVSHELRTPLGAILGYTELLQNGTFGPLTDQQLEVTAEVIDSTHYLTNMVNELLDQAQFETGKAQLIISPFPITEVIKQIESRMSVLAQAKGLTLITEIAPDLPRTLVGDVTRIQQILVNLVSNAIKFTRAGSVRVRLYCPNPDQWAIQVTDTGVGIPQEAQAYIFEPFRQVDGSMTREYIGTGLGLSIVKQLTTLMGGHITLESEVGHGSSFTVILPLEPAEEKLYDPAIGLNR